MNIDNILGLGTAVDYSNPQATTISSAEILKHIKGICRYNGGIPVTLLEHSAFCALLAENDITHEHLQYSYAPLGSSKVQPGYAAIHDFAEVYVGDVVTRLKAYLVGYAELEASFDNLVHNAFNLPLRNKNAAFVKQIDRIALCVETEHHKHPMAEWASQKYGIDPKPYLDIYKTVKGSTESKQDFQWRTITDIVLFAGGQLP